MSVLSPPPSSPPAPALAAGRAPLVLPRWELPPVPTFVRPSSCPVRILEAPTPSTESTRRVATGGAAAGTDCAHALGLARAPLLRQAPGAGVATPAAPVFPLAPFVGAAAKAEGVSRSVAADGTGAAQRLRSAWLFKLLVCTVEVFAALATGSLLLAADAIHMGVDLFAFGIAWLAATYAARRHAAPGAGTFERGAALLNAGVLAFAAWHITEEALESFGNAEPINFLVALGAASLRLAANHRAMRIMQRGDMNNPNERAIEAHCRMEAYASAGLIGALMLAAATGASFADPLISIVIALMMLRAAAGIVRIAFAPSICLDTSVR